MGVFSKVKHILIKRKWIFITLLIVGLGLWFYFRNKANSENKALTAYEVKKITFIDSLSFSGAIDAEEHEVLRFQTPGKLAWVGVKEGDIVQKNQAIASLDQRDLQKRLKKDLNDFSSARKDFDQSKDDNQDSSVNGVSNALRTEATRLIEKSQSTLNNAVLDVELQTLALEYANLYTPIAGIVTKAEPAHPGVNVTTVNAEYEIVNPDTLFFSATADQTEVTRLNEGMKATIILDAFPDDTFTGTISSISFTPKEGETGTVYGIKLKLDSLPGLRYRLGMTGDATFNLKERKNVTAIPSDYVIIQGDKQYVMKQEGNEKKKVEVKTGEELDGNTEIISGVQEGDTVYGGEK